MRQTSDLAGSTRIPRAEHRSHEVRGNDACEGPSAAQVRVLVVEDEAAYGRCLVRTIERCGGAATLVGTLREAREQLASGGMWTGLIADVRLPDGSGLHFLREARERGVQGPALIITGLRDNALAHAAFELRATYLVKPVEGVYVESLVHHASEVAESEHTRLPIQRVMADWRARYGLSEAEGDILFLAANGQDRLAITLTRGSRSSTTNRHVHNLLQKTGDGCLWEAINRLLREALNG